MLGSMEMRPEHVRPLRRVEFEQLVETGAFADARVELLDGRLVEMSPQGASHSRITARLAKLLFPHLAPEMDLLMHSPFAAGALSLPEPDLSIVPSYANDRHPERAWLVVEVSDSTLHNDRKVKSGLYARARVPSTESFTCAHAGSRCERCRAQVATPARSCSAATRSRPLLIPHTAIPVASLFRS